MNPHCSAITSFLSNLLMWNKSEPHFQSFIELNVVLRSTFLKSSFLLKFVNFQTHQCPGTFAINYALELFEGEEGIQALGLRILSYIYYIFPFIYIYILLTKENCKMFRFFDESVKHLICHFLDFFALNLMDKPLQNFIFCQQVPYQSNGRKLVT